MQWRGTPGRLIATIAAATLLPLAVLAFAAVRFSGAALRAEVEARLRNNSTLTSVYVQQRMTGFLDLAESYALRPSLIEQLQARDRQALEQHLAQLQHTGSGVAVAFVVGLDGALLAISPVTPSLIGQNFSYRDYFRGVVATDGPYISEIYYSKATGNPRVTVIAVPIRVGGPGSRQLAILAIGYDTSHIGTFTRDFAQAQGVSVTITDQRGVVVASSEGVPQGLESRAAEPAVAAALRGQSSMTEVERGGARLLIASAPVHKLGWTVQCAVAEDVAEAPLRRLRQTVLATALVLALVLVFALVLLRRTLLSRERAEQTLRESEARMAGILEAANDAFVSMDQRGQITAWNRQAEVLFGWPRAEAIGRSMAELIVPPQHREAHSRGMTRFLRTGEHAILNKRIEITALDRAGREFPVELGVWPSTDRGVPSFHAFVHDITLRRRAADELAAARDQATEASRLKSAFLANMSHEIRTPMNGIIGMTELVLGTELTRSQREYLAMVRSSAESLLRVINDILDFSKIEADKLTIEKEPFGLRNLLADVVRPLGANAAEKGLELVMHVDTDVPDGVVGDAARLGQVLINIVGNAIKFTAHGEVVVRVTLESRAPDSAVLRFSVVDSGVGIAREHQQAIFEAFTQADLSTTRRFGGTGLGLTISSRFVALMGGTLTVESEPGKGATFSFNLPVALQPDPDPARPLLPPSLHDLPVLLVDDNASSLLVLAEMFRAWRMLPTACADPDSALAALDAAAAAHRPYRLALIDAQPEGSRGPALATLLHAHPGLRGGVVLMVTPAGAAHSRAEEHTLLKPIRQSELLNLVMELSNSEDASRPRPPAGKKAARALRVLLAEDNAVNQHLARALLEKEGHAVTLASDGDEAVQQAITGGFEVALMDVQMPGLDGLEATAAIRRHELRTGGHLPIIGVTAHALQGDRERCLAAGMDGYVAKPIRPETLFKAIAEVVPQGPERAASRTPAEVFDEREVLALLSQDHTLMLELVSLFLLDSPRRMTEIRAALERKDWKSLRLAAHSLKASAQVLCGRRTASAALALEQAAAQHDLEAAKAGLEALAPELLRLQAVLGALPRHRA